MKKFLLLLFSVVTFCGAIQAQTFQTINSGNWEDSGTWLNGQIPNVRSSQYGNPYRIIIKHDVSYNGNVTVGGNTEIIINSGTKLDIDGNLTVNGSSNVPIAINSLGEITCKTYTQSSTNTETFHRDLICSNNVNVNNGDMTIDGLLDCKFFSIRSNSMFTSLSGSEIEVGEVFTIQGAASASFTGTTSKCKSFAISGSGTMTWDGGSLEVSEGMTASGATSLLLTDLNLKCKSLDMSGSASSTWADCTAEVSEGFKLKGGGTHQLTDTDMTCKEMELRAGDPTWNGGTVSVSENVEISGGQNVVLENLDFECKGLEVSGGSSLKLMNGTAEVSENVEVKGGSDLSINGTLVEIQKDIEIAGGSELVMTGRGRLIVENFEISGGSDLTGTINGGTIFFEDFDGGNNSFQVTCTDGRFYDTNNPPTSPLDLATCVGASGIAFPVAWQSFTVTLLDDQVVLDWATASELNNAYFEVQRSANDGTSWEAIGQVAGAGDSDETIYYSFTDGAVPLAAAVYYRLRQVDFDGTFDYSPLVSVHPQADRASGNGPLIYPNPATQDIYIRTNPGMDIRELSLVDLVGRTYVLPQLADGHAALPIRLPAGYYYLHVVTSQGTFTLPLSVVR